MIKKILFSALFMMIGYCSFGQGGQYIVFLKTGYCYNQTTGSYTWANDPEIVTITPDGSISTVALSAPTSYQNVLEHTAQFNSVVSDIMIQGYTVAPTSSNYTVGTSLTLSFFTGGFLGFSDGLCPNGQYGYGGDIITLIPCCTPP